jgi:hypothetical protein
MTDQEREAREFVRRQLIGGRRSLRKEGSRAFFREKMRTMHGSDIEWLLRAAREDGDPNAIELIREHVRAARQTGIPVPQELHLFVWEWFLDGPPKRKPAQKVQDNLTRNMILTVLVQVVSDHYGFQISRGSATAEKGHRISASQIVAEELNRLGRKLQLDSAPNEKQVEDIWRAGRGNLGVR